MKTSRLTALLILTLVLVLITIGCNNDATTLKLATYTYANNNRIDNLTPLANELEVKLGRPVKVISYPDVASLLTAIKSNKVDVALINTLGHLLLSLDNENMQPVATLKVRKDAIDNYKSVLLSNNDSIYDLQTLSNNTSDLSMMFVAEGSTSGNLIPRLSLSSININSPETQFKSVKYGGNHTSTFNKLLNGESDICAIGSNEYFKQVKANPTLLKSVKLLWTSSEIPLGPVLINNSLTNSDKENIINLLLKLHIDSDYVLQSLKEGWSEAKQADKFYAIDDSYYNNFRIVNGKSTDLTNILNQFAK